MDPPLTQDNAKRPRLEAEGAPGSPVAFGPASAATAAAAAGAAAANAAVAAVGAVAAAAAPAVAPAAADGAPGGPLLLAELEYEEGDGLPEDGYALGEFMYGEKTPKDAGGSSRRGSAVPKGVWVFVNRIKHPGLRTRLLANGQIMHTHVCIKCWARLKLWYVSSEQRFVTTAAVAHLRLHDGDETGEASKLKQIAVISSIILPLLFLACWARTAWPTMWCVRRLAK